MKISDKTIGNYYKPFIIAEAAISHQGNFATAKDMVLFARATGCDAIKFQMHVLEDEMLEDVPTSNNFSKPLFQTLKETEFSYEQHQELKEFCDTIGIIYLCTPFSRKAADLLEQLDVAAYKVGSGELTNIPLIKHIASKGKPVILSTGMSTIEEVQYSVSEVLKVNSNLAITHCVSAYPCPYEITNLKLINSYQEKFKIPVGLSDHSRGIYTSLGAVALGAALIEKHFTLDKLQEGPDHEVSLEPDELDQLVKGCNAVFKGLGSEKSIHDLEKPIMAWARESVVSITSIKKGDTFSYDNLWVKRPSPDANEFPAKELENLIGKIASRDIPVNTKIKRDDVA